MYVFFAILIVIVCVLLILVVLVQNSKGGGLAANFSGSTQVMGVRKTADLLEKATWIFAASLLILSILASVAISRNTTTEKTSRLNGATTTTEQVIPNGIPSVPSDHPDAQNE